MKELLDLMMTDMKQAHPLYQPTQFWEQCIPQILADIELFGWENFYAHPSAQDFYAATVADEHLQRHAEVLAQDNPELPPILHNYSQSLVGCPFRPFRWEERHLSFTSLNYLRGLVFLKQHVDTSNLKQVLEIGGGFGAFGEILLNAGHPYVNVDIPPLAALSTYYLREVFGHDAVLDYSQTRDLPAIEIGSARAIVLCPWQLPRLQGEVQLAANFISFQEMEPAVIDHYAAHIKRLTNGPILLRNSPTGKFRATVEEPLGVKVPATRADYQTWFAPWKLTARDVETFGDSAGDFVSEVMLFTR